MVRQTSHQVPAGQADEVKLDEISPEELPLEAEHLLRREGVRDFWEEPRLHLPQAGALRLELVGPFVRPCRCAELAGQEDEARGPGRR
jgi:hypothetical protein